MTTVSYIMTKQDELNILYKARKELGDDSYLGPWLANIENEVNSLIWSDLFPEINLAETAEKCRIHHENVERESLALLEEGKRQAAYLIAKAETEADEIISKAKAKTLDRLRSARGAADRLIMSIEDLEEMVR